MIVPGPAVWKLAAMAVALVLAAGAGWRQGVLHTRAAWQAADLARERVHQEALNEDRRRAGRAATDHETMRAAIAAALPEAQHEIRTSLEIEACPEHAEQLGAVVVPAAALAGLRHAAGDGDPPGPAATQPVRAVPVRPGDPGH